MRKARKEHKKLFYSSEFHRFIGREEAEQTAVMFDKKEHINF
jgi:hypothetical protein